MRLSYSVMLDLVALLALRQSGVTLKARWHTLEKIVYLVGILGIEESNILGKAAQHKCTLILMSSSVGEGDLTSTKGTFISEPLLSNEKLNTYTQITLTEGQLFVTLTIKYLQKVEDV
jgi:hypothetical protein